MKKHILFFAVCFFCSFAIILVVPFDPDLGWHLRQGEIIWQTKSFPTTQSFSYNFTDYKIADFYWLSQVIFYLLVSRLGLISLPLLTSLVGSGVVLVLLFSSFDREKLKKSALYKGVFFLLAVVLSYGLQLSLHGGRPMLFGLVFVAALKILLGKVLHGQRWPLLVLPPLFLAWANFYGDFIYGLWVFVAFAYFILICKLLYVKWFPWRQKLFNFVSFFGALPEESLLNWPLVLGVFASLTASALATFINPYGPFLWRSILADVDSFHLSHIQEWGPLNVHNDLGKFMLAVICFCVAFGWYWRKKISLFDLAVIFGLSALLLRFLYPFRYLLIWSVIPLYLGLTDLGENLASLLDADLLRRRVFFFYPFFIAIPVVCGAVFGVNRYFFDDVLQNIYPVRVLSYLGEKAPGDRVFNEYNWGGYLVWKRPNWPLFIYGQMPAWKQGDESAFRDFINLKENPSRYFEGMKEKYNFDWALVKSTSILADFWRQKEGWRELYRDETASVFVELKE